MTEAQASGAIDDLLDEIERALAGRLWLLALFGSLTIPDVCSALESEDGETKQHRYRTWFDNSVAPRYASPGNPEPMFTGSDCWRYRCAMLHQGISQPSSSRYSRVVFLDPDLGGFWHRNVMNDVLNLDLRTFCQDVIASARDWQVTAGRTRVFQKNAERMFRRHPTGIPPAIVGIPLYG
jgi:hypothetical protein